VKLTDIELEVMDVLWKSREPMTASDIVVASPKRTWKDTSIHVILKTLQAKNAVVIDGYVPTTGRTAKTYKAVVTTVQYVASNVREFDISILELLETLAGDKNFLKKKEYKITKDFENNE